MPPRKKIVTPPLETRDMYMSAYFLSAGAKLIETKRVGTTVTFVFEGETAGKLRNSWLDMSGMVSAQTYAAALRSLKQVCAHDS